MHANERGVAARREGGREGVRHTGGQNGRLSREGRLATG
jgi:hypothetical protein